MTIASSTELLWRPNGPQPILAVAPAEQPAHRLAGNFAEDIPERDVDPADCVRDRAATILLEGVLVQFLTDSLGLQLVFASIQWPEDGQRAADQIVACEDAAQADNPLVDQHDHQGVDTIIRAQLILIAFRFTAPRFVAEPPFGE